MLADAGPLGEMRVRMHGNVMFVKAGRAGSVDRVGGNSPRGDSCSVGPSHDGTACAPTGSVRPALGAGQPPTAPPGRKPLPRPRPGPALFASRPVSSHGGRRIGPPPERYVCGSGSPSESEAMPSAGPERSERTAERRRMPDRVAPSKPRVTHPAHPPTGQRGGTPAKPFRTPPARPSRPGRCRQNLSTASGSRRGRPSRSMQTIVTRARNSVSPSRRTIWSRTKRTRDRSPRHVSTSSASS